MPFAAVIEDRIFWIHSGLSIELTDLNQIRNITRPTDIPDYGLITDLLWSDPDSSIIGFQDQCGRSISMDYGVDVVEKFLDKNNFSLIVRAHQVVEDGYEYFGNRKLVTLFSVPNYWGEFDNNAAVMKVDDSLEVSFTIIRKKKKIKKFTQ